MVRWGMVPLAFHEILQFVGLETEARRVFCARVSKSVREAATAAIWRARRHWSKPDPKAPRHHAPPTDGPTAPRGDRGRWQGAHVGNMELRQEQEREHDRQMQPKRDKMLADARERTAKERMTAAGSTPSEGSFTRVRRGQQAGGRVVAASSGTGTTQQLHNTLENTASRSWATLHRWHSWSDERTSRNGTRFSGLMRLPDGVCQKRLNGVRCGQSGFRGEDGQMLCGGCRAAPRTVVSCDCCGIAASGSIAEWVSVGRWTMVCAHCLPKIRALPVTDVCDGCQAAPACRVTADGSNACRGCADSSSSAFVWVARAQRLCDRSCSRMRVSVSSSQARALALAAAAHFAAESATDFAGNAVLWRDINSFVARWIAQEDPAILVATLCFEGCSVTADSHEATWQQAQSRPKDLVQSRSLEDMGFSGRQIAVSLPIFQTRSVRSTRTTIRRQQSEPGTIRDRSDSRPQPSPRSNSPSPSLSSQTSSSPPSTSDAAPPRAPRDSRKRGGRRRAGIQARPSRVGPKRRKRWVRRVQNGTVEWRRVAVVQRYDNRAASPARRGRPYTSSRPPD